MRLCIDKSRGPSQLSWPASVLSLSCAQCDFYGLYYAHHSIGRARIGCAIARSHARTDYRRLACMRTPRARALCMLCYVLHSAPPPPPPPTPNRLQACALARTVPGFTLMASARSARRLQPALRGRCASSHKPHVHFPQADGSRRGRRRRRTAGWRTRCVR